MPKENTHLHFAKKIREINLDLQKIIDENINYFYLGSITPDAFYYSNKKEIKEISNFIHGGKGNPTNKIIFDLLDLAKKNRDEKLLAFTFGFLTHCYLDITFHPVVNHFALKSDYKHRRIEVVLDEKVTDDFYFDNLIDRKLFELKNEKTDKNLIEILSGSLNISAKDTKDSFKRQFLFNKLFKSKYISKILCLLYKIPTFSIRNNLAFFYGKRPDDEDSTYFVDMIKHEELFAIADQKTKSALISAHRYFMGEVGREEAEKNIVGESLDTGNKIQG